MIEPLHFHRFPESKVHFFVRCSSQQQRNLIMSHLKRSNELHKLVETIEEASPPTIAEHDHYRLYLSPTRGKVDLTEEDFTKLQEICDLWPALPEEVAPRLQRARPHSTKRKDSINYPKVNVGGLLATSIAKLKQHVWDKLRIDLLYYDDHVIDFDFLLL